jgi:3-methyl-2-oxobutanoate hydroxymethyltransferase
MRIRITDILEMKKLAQPIPCLTAYDYPTARIVDEAGAPLVLVGDSVGNVVLGYDSTVPVTMDEMLHHVRSVVRGTVKSLVVADLPFMSYQVTTTEGVHNAGRMLKEGGAQAVKIEGGKRCLEVVRSLVEIGIPVMGHIGITPQSINLTGGYRVEGKTVASAISLINDADALAAAGVFSIVLEATPAAIAKIITERLSIPTIGIGSGPYCDGQIQVLHDIVGMGVGRRPRHAKEFCSVNSLMSAAIRDYITEVRDRVFPTEHHSPSVEEEVVQGVLKRLV